MTSCDMLVHTRPRNPRNPVPPRPDLAGKIAGLLQIPIGRYRENIRDFRPDPTRPGFREIGESRFGRDRENKPRCPGIGDFWAWLGGLGGPDLTEDLARVLWRKLPILMALAPSLAGRRRGRPPGASLVDAIDGPWGAALAGTVAG